MELDLEKILESIKKSTDRKYEVFEKSIEKDEVLENESFFIYFPYNSISKSGNTDLKQDFQLVFITREDASIQSYIDPLIKNLRLCGLRFDNMPDPVSAEYKGTGEDVWMYILNFHKIYKCV